VIKKRGMPFPFSRKNIRPHRPLLLRTVKLGAPIALQDLLVSISFLVLLAIVNSLGLIASAGMGVAQKLCSFIMLVPSAFSQSLSAFVAQNIGAGETRRARKAMVYGMAASFLLGCIMGYLGFFHGDLLCGIFARDHEVILAGWDYLKAYAIDTLLVAFLFCFIGYFNGCGSTTFVMLQGLIGAFGVRIPVSWAVSKMENVTLFKIGLATPASTIVQIIMCTCFFLWLRKKQKRI
jgi:Na+-driven multidrug efflux pump